VRSRRTVGKGVVKVDNRAVPVDPTNAAQAGRWDGAEGEDWALNHQGYERLLSVFDRTLLEAGAVRPNDRCLDVGCGTGPTTRALARRAVNGSAVGLDLSGPMLQVARETARRAAIRNVEFVRGDAQVYPFEPGSFDVAVSRMGCMFFGDPATAFANVGRAMRPGGRVAFVAWQAWAANRWLVEIDTALGDDPPDSEADAASGYTPGPFSLADPAICAELLQRAGFIDIAVEGLSIPLDFGSVDVAQAFLETWIGDDLGDDSRARAKAALHRLVIDNASPDGVLLESATWLMTGRRPGRGAADQHR